MMAINLIELNDVIKNNERAILDGVDFGISDWQTPCGTKRCLWGNHLFYKHGRIFDDSGTIIETPKRTLGLSINQTISLFYTAIEDVADNDIRPYIDRLCMFALDQRKIQLLKEVIALNEESIKDGDTFCFIDFEDKTPCGTTRCLWGNYLYKKYGEVFKDGKLLESAEDYGLSCREEEDLFLTPIDKENDKDINPYLDRIRNYITTLESRYA